MKRLILISLIAVALIVTGCLATRNISGRGTVKLLIVNEVTVPPESPIEANFSLNFACYAQNNNRVEGNLNWFDPTNGVRISATLPETPVRVFTDGEFTTCKAMKAAASTQGFSVTAAGIFSEDGNADGDPGTVVAAVFIMVSEPGRDLVNPWTGGPMSNACEPVGEGTAVLIWTESVDMPPYMAYGCLDRGKIVFGNTQNQQ